MSIAGEKLIALAERRTRLQVRARAEREALAPLIERADELGNLALRAQAIVEELRRRPWIVAGAVGLLVALRPRRALGWLAKGWSAWQFYRRAQLWLARLARSGDAPARS
jgi:hypothetical protein